MGSQRASSEFASLTVFPKVSSAFSARALSASREAKSANREEAGWRRGVELIC